MYTLSLIRKFPAELLSWRSFHQIRTATSKAAKALDIAALFGDSTATKVGQAADETASEVLTKSAKIREKAVGRSVKKSKKAAQTVTLPESDGTMRILNVAEKNDAAKGIAGYLSNGALNRRPGRSKYNMIYEFDYQVNGRNCRMAMTSVSGHLLSLEFVPAYRKWTGCNPLALFDAPVRKCCPEDSKPVKQTLEEEARRCGMLIVWTDCDREGENIGFEVISVCREVNPNIVVKRAKFSEITRQSVTRAMASLGEPDQQQSDAVDVRQELDLRIGAAFTRFQTLRLQKVFPQKLQGNLISYGSCQFPTLGFVVERYKAVEQFIPEMFWKIKVTHEWKNGVAEFSWARGRLFDKAATEAFLDICLENPEATVTMVKTKPKSKWRPQPLDTIELEKSGSRKLKINAKETMKVAEKLYTQGFISYPRTETTIFPKELNLVPLVQAQADNANWGDFASRILQRGPNPRQGKKSDQAHPPIHPLKAGERLQGDEARVYEFIVRHFLACLSDDAKGMETSIEIKINKEIFNAQGLIILERNYLEVYPYEKWSDKEIPQMEEGDKFVPSKIEMASGETSAPPLLTEADLIALMDKHGIGTDATHADHIETVKSRLYVGLMENKFVPGELGMGLVQGYDDMGFEMSKPHMRAGLEADLKRICEGLRNPQEVLQEQIARYKDVFIKSVSDAMKLDRALQQYFGDGSAVDEATVFGPDDGSDGPPAPIMKCPQCRNVNIVLRTKKPGTQQSNAVQQPQTYYLSCLAFPDCKASLWFPEGIQEARVTPDKCPRCPTAPNLIEFKFRLGAYPLLPERVTTCVGGCDPDFMDQLQIRPIRPGPPTGTNPNPPFGNTGRHPGGTVPRAAPSARPIGLTAPRPRAGPHANTSGGAIVCNCNADALLLTVRKEGRNQGRQFYKCGSSSCNFFMWADGGDSGNPSSQNTSRGAGTGNTSFQNGGREAVAQRTSAAMNPVGDDATVLCGCGIAAVRRRVQREGPNKGKEFYACPKDRSEQCNFFQWSEGVAVVAPRRGRGRGGTAAAGRGGNAGGGRGGEDAKKQRLCGKCRQPGHTVKNCPNA